MVVAVPTVSHADVGCRLLERGIHVLVEKPIAPDLRSADRLLASARRSSARGRATSSSTIPPSQHCCRRRPRPRFVEVQRLSVFGLRSLDIDVILDLMIHDLQILHALDPSPVREVRAAGVAVLSDRIDIANARVELASGCVANLTASRVSAERVRRLRLFSRERYYSLDYQEQTSRATASRPRAAASVASSRSISRWRATSRCGASSRRSSPPAAAIASSYVDGRAGRAALETALAIAAAAARRRHEAAS